MVPSVLCPQSNTWRLIQAALEDKADLVATYGSTATAPSSESSLPLGLGLGGGGGEPPAVRMEEDAWQPLGKASATEEHGAPVEPLQVRGDGCLGLCDGLLDSACARHSHDSTCVTLLRCLSETGHQQRAEHTALTCHCHSTGWCLRGQDAGHGPGQGLQCR
jgi:hypothetical protein